jgi:LPXTG-site transpeptidase (sortase) family protein
MKNFIRKFSIILIFFSIIFFLLGIHQIWLRNVPNRLSFQNYAELTAHYANAKELPKRIIIKSKHIDVPVLPARVTNNIWETTPNGASYLTSSPIPGASGNSIVYAHNWASLFGNLPSVKRGDIVEIEYMDGSRKTFTIAYTSIVSPNESKVLSQTNDKRVTLYTCTGFLDTKRFVAVAILQDNS